MPDQNAEIVGYSVFELFEECYVYNENECYIVIGDVLHIYIY